MKLFKTTYQVYIGIKKFDLPFEKEEDAFDLKWELKSRYPRSFSIYYKKKIEINWRGNNHTIVDHSNSSVTAF